MLAAPQRQPLSQDGQSITMATEVEFDRREDVVLDIRKASIDKSRNFVVELNHLDV